IQHALTIQILDHSFSVGFFDRLVSRFHTAREAHARSIRKSANAMPAHLESLKAAQSRDASAAETPSRIGRMPHNRAARGLFRRRRVARRQEIVLPPAAR